ncbi:hypothetical protein CRM90_11355 [Mycobacterium sp. ENV421]|uniref:class I SAM-dependent methyltransferase n=1 Tax=Mycobacterium sp. ENV421 TaxID=1213407 RepID=UPI000C9A59A6|nr:class I SAM-dependent methyltransferase [Mycobacterium sp. ENV421]PND57582.1 hypothetical protein CRM90_11355 [Mycobacterium sp. ENV421]
MREADTNEQEATLSKPDIHAEWASDYRQGANERFYNECFVEILKALAAPTGARFLDAGCGSGSHSIRLAERGYRVEAVDFSEAILESARQRVDEHNVRDRVTLRQGNLRALPYADGEFEYVLCWGVLMHVPDLEAAIAELSRVVAPGGALVVHEANMNSLQSAAQRTLLRALRRQRKVVRTDAGIEKWRETDAGKVMTREARPAWLISEFEKHGLRLRTRRSGEFTEAYARVPAPVLQKVIHDFNSAWFRHSGPPHFAFTNVLIFDRPE